MGAVRQEVRYQRLRGDEGEEEEVSVQLYSPSSRSVFRARCRDATLRICSSLVLLAVAIGFVLYELEYGSLDSPSVQHSFHDHMGPSWNTSTLETHHHGPHHPSEDLEGHQHGDNVQSGSLPAGHSHSAGTYHHAAAVTDSEFCSGVARDILQVGGSVVDAGISAVLCLAVVHSHTVSLGGLFSSIYYNGTTQNASVLNAIANEASPTLYGVPAVLQGLWSLHQRHGRKLWSELLSPAIGLASQGFLVDSSLHRALEKNQNKAMSSEGLHGLFYDHDTLRSVGASVTNLPLGKVLEIAKTMRNSALPEELIRSLVGDLEASDGEKFRQALSKVRFRNEDPVQLHLDGMTLYSSTAPTAGSILASAVEEVYLKDRRMPSASISEPLINASKTVYTMAGAWPPDSGSARPQRHLVPVGSSVVVADANGDVLVITLTLNSTFGSGFVSPSTGILLSDFVQGASSAASAPLLFWACPSVFSFGADDGIMGLAARGGSSLPLSLARVLLSRVVLQMDLEESVNGTLTDGRPGDPWLKYLGLQGGVPETVMAVEVRAEHIHVATSQDCSCHPAGL